MTARILHLSDLHMGHGKVWEPLQAVERLVAAIEPQLVLATGDLAHRGRIEELEAAAGLLRGLGAPLLAVPGNHDIPYTVPARFTRTFDAWTRVFETTEPVHDGRDGLAVVGLSSARAWRPQGGALEDAALRRALDRLEGAPAGALRVVAFHHHLATPPWRAARKRPLSRRDDVLRALRGAGVELVVGGHVHQASVTETREFRVLPGDGGSLVLATAPGLGRPRPSRREEVRGANVYEATEAELVVITYAWTGGELEAIGRRAFSRR